MSLTRNFKTNENAINKGVPVTLPENDDGSVPTIYVARMHASNQRYQKAITAAMKPHQFEIQRGKFSEEKAQELLRSVFASTCVTGMVNVLLSDVTGDENDTGFAEFTRENVERLLTNLPELYEMLVEKAKDIGSFLDASNKEVAGN